MKKINELNVLTCRSQVRNPAGLRRFPSPHPSLFFWIISGIFGLKCGGNGVKGLYMGGRAGRPRGATAPCRLWVGPVARGGATGPPCPHAPPARDLFVN